MTQQAKGKAALGFLGAIALLGLGTYVKVAGDAARNDRVARELDAIHLEYRPGECRWVFRHDHFPKDVYRLASVGSVDAELSFKTGEEACEAALKRGIAVTGPHVFPAFHHSFYGGAEWYPDTDYGRLEAAKTIDEVNY